MSVVSLQQLAFIIIKFTGMVGVAKRGVLEIPVKIANPTANVDITILTDNTGNFAYLNHLSNARVWWDIVGVEGRVVSRVCHLDGN